MGIFTPKSKKDLAIDYATAAVTKEGVKGAAKLVGGAVVGFFTLTAASAAISAARHQEQS